MTKHEWKSHGNGGLRAIQLQIWVERAGKPYFRLVRRLTTEQFHDGAEHSEQNWLSYTFDLEAIAPDDHQVRPIAALLDLTLVRTERAPHYARQVCSTASFAELEE